MYDLGLRLKTFRSQRGLTQEALGRRINKSKSAICSYETNAQMPPLDVLLSISSALNVSLDQLVGIDTSDSISIRHLSADQRSFIGKLLTEFNNPTNHSKVLSQQQIIILQELIALFSCTLENTGK